MKNKVCLGPARRIKGDADKIRPCGDSPTTQTQGAGDRLNGESDRHNSPIFYPYIPVSPWTNCRLAPPTKANFLPRFIRASIDVGIEMINGTSIGVST